MSNASHHNTLNPQEVKHIVVMHKLKYQLQNILTNITNKDAIDISIQNSKPWKSHLHQGKKKQIHTKAKDFSTSIALLGATRITLTRFPLNNPFHPSVFMILLKTSVVECPLLPTIKCVLIVSNGATAVRDTAPAIAPLINLLNEGFATLTFNFRPTFPLLELPSSAASGIPKILNPSGEDTYFTYRSIHGSFKPALLLSREFGEFGEIPNPIPTWPTLANRPPG